MKKLTFAITAFCALSFSVAAEEVSMSALTPLRPSIMAQGGSSVATATGYDALFSNPAGFASSKGSLTLLSVNPWFFANPQTLSSSLSGGEIDSSVIGDLLASQSENGVGIGASAGLGYVGRGLALAVVNTTEIYMSGTPFPGGVSGYIAEEVSFIGGLALTPINGKKLKWTIGADLRPSVRMYSALDGNTVSDVLDAMSSDSSDIYTTLDAVTIAQGAGLGIDVGTKLSLGGLSLGLSVRDLFGTKYGMTTYGLGSWVQYFNDYGTYPTDGTASSDTYVVPMDISVGAAYHLDLGKLSFLVDPTVHASISDPLAVINDGQSPWALLHAGAEVKVLRFLKFWGGVNQGYLTAGAGAKLLFLDMSVAAFTNEMGKYAGDSPSTGVTAEVALRF